MVEGARAEAGGDAGGEDDRGEPAASRLCRERQRKTEADSAVEAELVEHAAEPRLERGGLSGHRPVSVLRAHNRILNVRRRSATPGRGRCSSTDARTHPCAPPT